VKERTALDYFWISARGFFMGAADIVPGVSGGTMAFILGVYEELLAAINAVSLEFVRHILALRWREAFREFPWRFLLALGLGIGTAILTLTQGLHWALGTHPSLLWSFFFGLILASILVVRKRVASWSAVNLLAACAAAAGAYILVGLSPSETPHTPLFLFLSGALAVCAMILPGISGAFILVLLGKYRYILAALVAFEMTSIAIVALGAVFGLIGFARLLRWLLREKHDLVVAILTGFMTGALRKVWPWKSYELSGDVIVSEMNFIPTIIDGEVAIALLFMAAGTIFVLLIEHFANRKQAEPSTVEY
jgi:putative membrane protein